MKMENEEMKGIKNIFSAAFFLSFGVIIGYFFGSHQSTYHVYSTPAPVKIFDRNGASIGILPENTLVTSELSLSRGPDFGWWGYVPIYFHSPGNASLLLKDTGVVRRRHFDSIAEVGISVDQKDAEGAVKQ